MRVGPPPKKGGFVMRCLDDFLRRRIRKMDMIG